MMGDFRYADSKILFLLDLLGRPLHNRGYDAFSGPPMVGSCFQAFKGLTTEDAGKGFKIVQKVTRQGFMKKLDVQPADVACLADCGFLLGLLEMQEQHVVIDGSSIPSEKAESMVCRRNPQSSQLMHCRLALQHARAYIHRRRFCCRLL